MVSVKSPSIHYSSILVSISLLHSSYAEIASCDQAKCPNGSYNTPQCVLGNMTASAIGISTFNSSLSSPQPLTWTLLVQAIRDGSNDFERDFILGKPPTLNLQQTNNTSQPQACSLFFEGVGTRLRFPGTDPEYDQGTCNDAITAACVNDLRTQGHDELNKILREDGRNGSTTDSVCTKLGNALQDHAPSSCAIAVDGKWGDLLTRPLTGQNASLPIPQGDCHPTTEDNYNLSLVAANRISLPSRNTSDLASVMFGITPIMTLVFGNGVPDVEVDLTCSKTVGIKAAPATNQKSGATMLSSYTSLVLIVATILASILLS